MSKNLKDDIEKEVKRNYSIKDDPEKIKEKKEERRKYQEDMARYMNGITMVTIKIQMKQQIFYFNLIL